MANWNNLRGEGDNITQFRMPDMKFNPRVLAWGVIGLLLFWGLATSIYTVQAEQVGVVLRFGKLIKTTEPGLRFKAPFGVDQVELVAVRRQMKQEFGFGTVGGTNRTQFSSSREEWEHEKSMVTGDLNAALVEWVIQYRISEPTLYLFKVRDPDDTLRDASESVMREVVGDRTVDEVITIGRQEIEDEALLKLQNLANAYEMGLTIDQIQLKNVNPPLPVQASFNEVNQAQQEREKLINIANGEYNKEVPKARGQAEQVISEAQGYAAQRVNEAEGDTNRFEAVFLEYEKAPEVTRRRLFLETMRDVLPNLGRKVIIDGATSQVLPLLQLDAQGAAAAATINKR